MFNLHHLHISATYEDTVGHFIVPVPGGDPSHRTSLPARSPLKITETSHPSRGFRCSDWLSLLSKHRLFSTFPCMFVFVHIRFDQVSHLHRVDLSTLAVTHLVRGAEQVSSV